MSYTTKICSNLFLREKSRPLRPRVVLAAGGTGGHVFPALAVAQCLEEKGILPLVMTSKRDEEKSWFQNCQYPLLALPSVKMEKSLGWLARLGKTLWQGRKTLARLRPSALLAFGGHTSFVPAVAALTLRIPLVCLEQNVIPGKVTRLLQPWARRTVLQWEESRLHMWRPSNGVTLGNPLRREIDFEETSSARRKLGLHPKKFTVLVMGGSQGARAINRAVEEVLPTWQVEKEKIQWIHLTGKADFERTRKAYTTSGFHALVQPFSNHMGTLYSAADLLLGRSGGGTIAEAAAAGLPMILVPYPHAADNHQLANAKAAQKRGAARIIRQSNLTSETLIDCLEKLLSKKGNNLEKMTEGASQLARIEAAQKVAGLVKDLLPSR